jgi:hypothetical protein
MDAPSSINLPMTHPVNRKRIRLVEGNAKSLRFESNLDKDFAGAVYLSGALSPPGFFPWDGQVQCNIVGSESDHRQSIIVLIVLQYLYGLQDNPPSGPGYTQCRYTVYFVTGGGGGQESVELETMPLNTFWSKFQKTIMNALAWLLPLCPNRVGDPHHASADPDSTHHPDADPDFHLMRMRTGRGSGSTTLSPKLRMSMWRTEKHEWEESEKRVMVGLGCLGGGGSDHHRETDSGIERLSSAGGGRPGGSAAPPPGGNTDYRTYIGSIIGGGGEVPATEGSSGPCVHCCKPGVSSL